MMTENDDDDDDDDDVNGCHGNFRPFSWLRRRRWASEELIHGHKLLKFPTNAWNIIVIIVPISCRFVDAVIFVFKKRIDDGIPRPRGFPGKTNSPDRFQCDIRLLRQRINFSYPPTSTTNEVARSGSQGHRVNFRQVGVGRNDSTSHGNYDTDELLLQCMLP